MASKVYEWKHCQDCGAGFNARGYPKAVREWHYCERCTSRHLQHGTFTITERDMRGNVLRVSQITR